MTGKVKGNYTILFLYSVIFILLLTPSTILAKPSENSYLIIADNHSAPNYRQLNFKLFDACKKGKIKLITKLLKQGASVKARNRFGNTALFYAARSGSIDAVKILLKYDSDINQQNLRGRTVLVDSLYRKKFAVVKFLIENGADVTINPFTWVDSAQNSSAVAVASFHNNIEIVEMLLKKGADADVVDNTKKSAILYAAAYGSADIVDLLIRYGVDIIKKALVELKLEEEIKCEELLNEAEKKEKHSNLIVEFTREIKKN
mgnify:CR=1 FL=1